MAITKYRATVTNLNDPEKRGRFKITCPDLLLNDEQEIPIWVEPELDYGWFLVPDIGQQVIVEINRVDKIEFYDEEEIGIQNFIMGMIIKWKGEVAFTDAEYEKPYTVSKEFQTNYPFRRGFVTKKGHIIIFDDSSGNETISITWKNKNKESSLVFDSTGSIIAEDASGNTIVMDAKNDKINLLHHAGSEIEITATAINIDAVNVNSKGTINNTVDCDSITDIKGAVININASAVLNISSTATIQFDAALINLTPGAVNAILKSPAFAAYFDTHVHNPPGPTEPPGGFTGSPLVKMTPLLATLVESSVLV